jgi:hypothetical protein
MLKRTHAHSIAGIALHTSTHAPALARTHTRARTHTVIAERDAMLTAIRYAHIPFFSKAHEQRDGTSMRKIAAGASDSLSSLVALPVDGLAQSRRAHANRSSAGSRPGSAARRWALTLHGPAHARTHAHARARARTHARTHSHAHSHTRTHSHAPTHTHARTHAYARTAQAVPQRYCNCSAGIGFGCALDGCADYAQANLPTHLIGGVLVALIISRLPRSDYAEYRRTGQHVPWPSCPRALTGIRIGWHHCCS